MFTTTIRHYDITFKIKTKVYDKYVNIFFSDLSILLLGTKCIISRYKNNPRNKTNRIVGKQFCFY